MKWSTWRKATQSGTNSNCVELAHAPGMAAVRDSKNTEGPVLTFPVGAVSSLLARAARGR